MKIETWLMKILNSQIALIIPILDNRQKRYSLKSYVIVIDLTWNQNNEYDE